MKPLDVQYNQPVTSFTFHPTKNIAFIAGEDGSVVLFDLEENHETTLFSASPPIICLHVLPESLLLFDSKGLVSEWNLNSLRSQYQEFLPFLEREGDWRKGAFTPDGSSLIIERYSKRDYPTSELFHFKLKKKEIVFEYQMGESDYYLLDAFAFSKDGMYFATSGMSYSVSYDWYPDHHAGCLNIWKVFDREILKSEICLDISYIAKKQRFPLSFSPCSRDVAMWCDDKLALVRCLDLSSEEIVTKEGVETFAFIPDGNRVTLGTKEGNILLAEIIEDYVIEGEVYDPPMRSLKFLSDERISESPILSLTASPNGKYLGAIDTKHQLQFFTGVNSSASF